MGGRLVLTFFETKSENEGDYGAPLPDKLTFERISKKWNLIPQHKKDRVLHSGSFHKTDADEVMERAETERGEQIATAFEIVSANGEDKLDEYDVDNEDDEIKDYHEQNVDFEDILAEIKDKRDLMIAMDEIRSSEYCTDFWFRSGVSHFRRAHTVDWMSKLQRDLKWSDNVLYAAVDLLDSYLFVNVIVPSDYEVIAFACLILAHHIRDNVNLEEVFQRFPEFGPFYTLNQVRNYVNEMKTRSCRYLCRCPTVMDYYDLYEPALIEFEDDLKDWVDI
ncbi:hypothetical protein ACTXT7_004878 [Hymenolepis weldensis]